MNNIGFKTLGTVDQLQKFIITLAAYKQFMDGDSEGMDINAVKALSVEERQSRASIYATSVARLTLTAGSQLDRAPLQKMKNFRFVTMFWNDIRNSLNNMFRQAREVKWHSRRGNYRLAAQTTGVMLLTMVVTRLMEDLIRGNETPLDELEKPEVLLS